MVEMGRANEAVVRALTEHLRRAYEEFLSRAEVPVEYVDGFMGAHNFHVLVVLDLERRVNASPAKQLFLRRLARDTFAKALEERE
jgi:hypothetical protein